MRLAPGSQEGRHLAAQSALTHEDSSSVPTSPIRVALADDSYLMRQALAAVLAGEDRVELVASCSDATSLLAAVEVEHPAVVITDIRMPPFGDDEGIRLAAELHRTHPEVGVVVLSQYVEPRYGLELLADGSDGRAYLLKERVGDRHQLLGAIDAVAAGGSFIDSKVVEALVDARMRRAGSPLAELTPRELEVLALIAEGKSNTAIGAELFLSKRAVEKHVGAILSKLSLPETEEVSRRVMATLIYLSDHQG
jgi:DNA-binding NarL/FixJ family response regulator